MTETAGKNENLLQVFRVPGEDSLFGGAVAGYGTSVLVADTLREVDGLFGAGQVYLFAVDGGHLATFRAPDVQGSAHFGRSVAWIGGNVLVGGPDHEVDGLPRAGQAYLFSVDGTHLTTFQAPEVRAGAHFGQTVAWVGENVLVGAPDHIVNGVNEVGLAHLFDQSGNLLQTFHASKVEEGTRFGRSVAGMEANVLVGAPGETVEELYSAGQAYLFDQSGNLLQTFQASEPQLGGDFGYSLVEVEGNVLVGAPSHDIDVVSDAGRAYLFAPDGKHLTSFRAPRVQPGDRFGSSVAAVENNVLVGAPDNYIDVSSHDGHAYLFSPDGMHLATFGADASWREVVFGRSVGGIGDKIIVGAPPNHSGGSTNRDGRAYLFARDSEAQDNLDFASSGDIGSDRSGCLAALSSLLVLGVVGASLIAF